MTPLTATDKKNLLLKTKHLRQTIIRMTTAAGAGHPGGSLSCIDILAVLFDKFLKLPPGDRSRLAKSHRFVLSKGHAAPALYAVLAASKIIPNKVLNTLRQLGSPLQGHPDFRFLPQAGPCTGSLGQGMSVAVGMALASKLTRSRQRIFVLLGDGEINEGQVWEAALAAAHHHLDNLIAIIDRNGFQQTGATSQIMSTDPLEDKWQAFNWNTFSINGHDLDQIHWALHPDRIVTGSPTMIIAYTTKGKGVSFMEGDINFHGKPASKTQLKQALTELA